MLRTLVTFFSPDVMPGTDAPRIRVPEPFGPDRLRLHWTARDGRLLSRWRKEPRNLVEEGVRRTDCAAA